MPVILFGALILVLLMTRNAAGLWAVLASGCGVWMLLFWPDINLTTHVQGAAESTRGWKMGAIGATAVCLAVLLRLGWVARKNPAGRGFPVQPGK